MRIGRGYGRIPEHLRHCVKCGAATSDWVLLRGKGPICRSHVGISPDLRRANREAAA